MRPRAGALLAIDVGNSRIKLGLFDSVPGERELPRCVRSSVAAADAALPWPEILAWAGVTSAATVIAGANPRGIARVLDGWPEELRRRPVVVDDGTRLPIRIHTDEPRKVGIDRLLNAVAANVIRPPGEPSIVVDTGTATTVDFVTADGAFAGGAILPGFELCARALHHYTALLPLLSIGELASEPHEPLGRSTRAALRSGLFWGQLGAVRELIARLSDGCARVHLLLTGGGAGLLAAHLPEARLERHLALQGIALVADDLPHE